MKFIIKSVEDNFVAKTAKGDKYVEHVIIEDDNKNVYKISRWELKSKIGEVIVGELGKYDAEYKEYKFKEDKESKAEASPPTKEDFTKAEEVEAQKQRRIAIESLISSAAILEASKKDVSDGAVWQFVMQGYNLVYEDKFVFYCTKEQREALVKRFGYNEAHTKTYSKFGVVYLHLLTYEQAQELINQPD